jgi:mevalonate kinase
MIAAAAVSSPGKTILMGEHAAVYGHPALVAALDVRMTVSVRPAAGDLVRLDMPAIGWHGEADWEALLRLAGSRRERWTDAFERGDGVTFDPVREPHELALFAVGETGSRVDRRKLPGLSIRVASAIPPRAGCGSSAALAVGIVGALSRALHLDLDEGGIAAVALAVERQQHGRPSGIDVEAVLRGGILWCRRGADGRIERDGLTPSPRSLAAFRLFHSGTPGETTGDMVAAVRSLDRRDPLRVRDALAVIDAATHEARAHLEGAEGDALVAVVRRCEAALEALGVVPEPVRAAIRAIERNGGAAKISGAGGATGGAGLVLVVHSDPCWHERFMPPPGWTPLLAALGAAGLRDEVAA